MSEQFAWGFAVNILAALAAYAARTVSVPGAAIGVAFGTLLYGAFSFRGWLQLLVFFALGSIATRFRYGEKTARGLGEARGGARGARKAAAKCAIPAALAAGMLYRPGDAWQLAVAGAFAAALADTMGSEFGPLYARRARHPFTARALAPGTPGAISLAGTLAGLAGAGACAAAAVASGFVQPAGLWLLPCAALAASYLESVAGVMSPSRSPWRSEVRNLATSALGALLALVLARLFDLQAVRA
ncbi:MAG: DUF92 domain-containing protein [Planctomycetes bacterium]|nr:DUF92 domain-containing protein [Planctomycetota bacterium]